MHLIPYSIQYCLSSSMNHYYNLSKGKTKHHDGINNYSITVSFKIENNNFFLSIYYVIVLKIQ